MKSLNSEGEDEDTDSDGAGSDEGDDDEEEAEEGKTSGTLIRLRDESPNSRRVSDIDNNATNSSNFKAAIYNTVIVPSLVYGSETCALRKNQNQNYLFSHISDRGDLC